MSNTLIPQGQFGDLDFNGRDANGVPAALSEASVSIDNYTAAYVAATPTPLEFLVVPKLGLPAGVNTTVTATVNAKDANGSDLPPLTISFDLQGPPAAPLATHLAFSAINVQSGAHSPDPGSNMVTLAVS